jgi:hypothetical protein
MYIIDFLFFFSTMHFEKLNTKYGIKRLEPQKGARNLIFISTFLWFMIIELLSELILYHKISFNLNSYSILLISVTLYGILNYVYIEKNRYLKILNRECSADRKFKIKDRKGETIVVIYIYFPHFIVFLGMIVRYIQFHSA